MAKERAVLTLTIDADLRDRYEAIAAQKGMSLNQWVQEAMNEKLEREQPDHPVHQVQIQEATGSLEDFLRLADELRPVLQKSKANVMNAARVIDAAREERLRSIVGE